VTVRLDGKITVALLGDVEAAGRSPEQIGKELQDRLARYVATPVVTVGLAQANSARFFVLGQVNRPGGIPMVGQVRVLDGLALAGGFKEFAKTDRILVIRVESGQSQAIMVNYKKLEEGADLGMNIALQPGDTLLVP
jgi:polysaccharide export outer membrane protein